MAAPLKSFTFCLLNQNKLRLQLGAHVDGSYWELGPLESGPSSDPGATETPQYQAIITNLQYLDFWDGS